MLNVGRVAGIVYMCLVLLVMRCCPIVHSVLDEDWPSTVLLFLYGLKWGLCLSPPSDPCPSCCSMTRRSTNVAALAWYVVCVILSRTTAVTAIFFRRREHIGPRPRTEDKLLRPAPFRKGRETPRRRSSSHCQAGNQARRISRHRQAGKQSRYRTPSNPNYAA